MSWQLQEAKQKFSELVRRTLRRGTAGGYEARRGGRGGGPGRGVPEDEQ